MANVDLSGPVVLTELMKYVLQMKDRRYTYRFVVNPETIGAITYISKNLDALQKNVKAGFVLSCVGDDRTYSYLATKYGDTLTDRVMQNVLKFHFPEYKKYSFLDRGSDERQYGSAGVSLPVCGFCRSLYTRYPEYHTSADNMDLISPEGLQGAYDVMVKVIKLNGLLYHSTDGEGRTATGVAVQLGQHHTVEVKAVIEGLCRIDGILTCHRIDHKEGLVRLHRLLDVGDFVHHLLVNS